MQYYHEYLMNYMTHSYKTFLTLLPDILGKGSVQAKTTNRVRTQVTDFFEKITSCLSMAQYTTCQIFFFLAE